MPQFKRLPNKYGNLICKTDGADEQLEKNTNGDERRVAEHVEDLEELDNLVENLSLREELVREI